MGSLDIVAEDVYILPLQYIQCAVVVLVVVLLGLRVVMGGYSGSAVVADRRVFWLSLSGCWIEICGCKVYNISI